jgi:hypothetical protein
MNELQKQMNCLDIKSPIKNKLK